jgi:hypothetical protein
MLLKLPKTRKIQMTTGKRMVEIKDWCQQQIHKCAAATKKNRPPQEPVHHTIDKKI